MTKTNRAKEKLKIRLIKLNINMIPKIKNKLYRFDKNEKSSLLPQKSNRRMFAQLKKATLTINRISSVLTLKIFESVKDAPKA